MLPVFRCRWRQPGNLHHPDQLARVRLAKRRQREGPPALHQIVERSVEVLVGQSSLGHLHRPGQKTCLLPPNLVDFTAKQIDRIKYFPGIPPADALDGFAAPRQLHGENLVELFPHCLDILCQIARRH